ncbi:hypothetical protein BDR26DRAFT_931404 [Obelidium mucronatum]|nr:hypothetical protein BDR26DRAFT_931404 [Obelidium mucronatum]
MIRASRILYAAAAAILLKPALGASCYTNLSSNEFENCKLLSPTFALHWTSNSSVIVFGVDVDIPSASHPWIGLGISEMGGMFGADMWLLKRNQSHGYYMEDAFSTTTAVPLRDAIQNVILLSPPVQSDINYRLQIFTPFENLLIRLIMKLLMAETII